MYSRICVKGPNEHDYEIKQPWVETQCGCDAHMIISLNWETGKYRVYAFQAKHNHELQLPQCIHMLPTHRKVSQAQAIQINMADDSGITLKASCELLGRQARGRTNLSFIKQDHKNYLRSKRMKSLQYGEAGSLLYISRSK